MKIAFVHISIYKNSLNETEQLIFSPVELED